MATNHIQKIPKYYIPRDLICRFRLDAKIFQAKVKDIFLVGDIALRELFNIARCEKVDRSSVQKRYVRARFILLEFAEDFDRIVKIVGNTSVHWIKMKEGHYFWKKTHGSLDVIQEHVSSEPLIVPEAKFCNEAEEIIGSIGIADEPGVGKSLLLASLCQMKLKSGNDNIALFIGVEALLEKLELKNTIHVLEAIADFAGVHAIGKLILIEILRSLTFNRFHCF